MKKQRIIPFLIGTAILFLTASANLIAQEHSKRTKTNKKEPLIINSDQSEEFLYILDGEILSDKDRKKIISGLDPKKIVSTKILKGSSELILKYGERAKYGVVLVTTLDGKSDSTKKSD